MLKHRVDLLTRPARSQIIRLDKLSTSIVGIDFPNEDAIKSNQRMDYMICAADDLQYVADHNAPK